jgi:hypothetical protein
MDYIHAIKEVLAKFEGLSSLKTNPDKSLVFCAGLIDKGK